MNKVFLLVLVAVLFAAVVTASADEGKPRSKAGRIISRVSRAATAKAVAAAKARLVRKLSKRNAAAKARLIQKLSKSNAAAAKALKKNTGKIRRSALKALRKSKKIARTVENAAAELRALKPMKRKAAVALIKAAVQAGGQSALAKFGYGPKKLINKRLLRAKKRLTRARARSYKVSRKYWKLKLAAAKFAKKDKSRAARKARARASFYKAKSARYKARVVKAKRYLQKVASSLNVRNNFLKGGKKRALKLVGKTKLRKALRKGLAKAKAVRNRIRAYKRRIKELVKGLLSARPGSKKERYFKRLILEANKKRRALKKRKAALYRRNNAVIAKQLASLKAKMVAMAEQLAITEAGTVSHLALTRKFDAFRKTYNKLKAIQSKGRNFLQGRAAKKSLKRASNPMSRKRRAAKKSLKRASNLMSRKRRASRKQRRAAKATPKSAARKAASKPRL